ncbi:hypothetical protein F0562_021453 [Nyssa sinensis]|uniref:Uncharacterized protein n=1 Tax=Nyssa sinensis TaxID=561372 RepID=A0A5J5BMU5_9ASTE|nr:hypothetical protein F0562_021453 [Nyssa sinensis]
MQSRLAATVDRSARVLFSAIHNKALPRRLASASTGRTADPDIHSGDPEGIDAEEAAKGATAQNQTVDKPPEKIKPLVSPRPPYAFSPKLESTGVNQPLDPTTQQKRRNTTGTNTAPLDDVSCAGLDGSPWSERESAEEEDYKSYYKVHKASPLSEIEIVDTRKPITRATDGTADSHVEGGSEEVILWRAEQLDTAEEALRRAMEIWKQSAMRGDPDSPHGRILRALRGENW